MVVEVERRVCDGQLFKWLVASALSWLEHNMAQVNNMNVFPVPDGDTGTNMFHTMERAYAEIAHIEETHIGLVSQGLARGALMGARGNSGTILSQILRGFADGLRSQAVMDSQSMVVAADKAVEAAYKAVTEPQEGTILTVIREAVAGAKEAAKTETDLSVLLELTIRAGRESLRRTPELLPVLREAGVVDSGGMGLIYLLEGMQRFVDGKPLDLKAKLNGRNADSAQVNEQWQQALVPEDQDGYGYDVQFLIKGQGLDVDRIRADIDAMGWSTLVVGDDQLIKVHVHVHDPGQPLSYGIGLGAELDDVVVENMQAQYQEYVEQRLARETKPSKKEVDGVAVITVVNGDGLYKIFDELHAARIIAGGQTMNPSTEDFLAAIDSLPNDEIIILPNNKNIILAAQQAAELAREKRVRVIRSLTVVQGVSALITYGDLREDSDLDDLVEAMAEALDNVVSCEVTRATRSVSMNGVSVQEGELIGLVDSKLIVSGTDINQVVHQVLHRAHAEDHELATLYYGQDVSAEAADTLVESLNDDFPQLEFEVVNGGQPLYPYIISVE